MTMKGLREGGRGESKGRVHGNPFPHCLYGTLLCSRERRFTHQRFQFTESKGGKKGGKKRYEMRRDWVADAAENRGRRGERPRGREIARETRDSGIDRKSVV